MGIYISVPLLISSVQWCASLCITGKLGNGLKAVVQVGFPSSKSHGQAEGEAGSLNRESGYVNNLVSCTT